MSSNYITKNIDNIQLKLNDAAGISVAIELRMRLIGQLSEAVRSKLKELATGNKRSRMSSDYWDCKLFLLDEAILAVFHDTLDDNEREKIKKFRALRNELLHANFVDLMELLAIEPQGREIISANENRNMLHTPDIKEALMSIDRLQGFEIFNRIAHEIVTILDRLITR